MQNEAQHIGSILGSLKRQLGYYTDRDIQQRLPKLWDEVVGGAASRSCQVFSFGEGTLVITAQAAVWRKELLLRKRDIIEKLNSALGAHAVKDLRFTVNERITNSQAAAAVTTTSQTTSSK